MINSLTWVTDPHLEFLPAIKIVDFAKKIDAHKSDAVLITGDISDARGISEALGILAKNTDKKIYFVLGNHDRYAGSFQKVEETAKQASSVFPNLVRLTGKEIIPLNNRVALVGIDGWADASAGTGAKTKVRLNDDNNIFDLLFLADQNARFDFMLQLAQGYAATLRPTLASALEKYDEVIVATHVPPFIEATWHE
jgi:predicted phosphohydrolase